MAASLNPLEELVPTLSSDSTGTSPTAADESSIEQRRNIEPVRQLPDRGQAEGGFSKCNPWMEGDVSIAHQRDRAQVRGHWTRVAFGIANPQRGRDNREYRRRTSGLPVTRPDPDHGLVVLLVAGAIA